jgi:hypothetical protein
VFISNLVQERERDTERERVGWVEGHRPSADANAEEPEAMAPMAQRSSGSSRRRSGGDDGRRGKRKPSGLHQHWPATGVVEANDVAVLGCFPSALRSPQIGRVVG